MQTRVSNVSIRGLWATVPPATEGIGSLSRIFGFEPMDKISTVTGIQTRHVCRDDADTCDLMRESASAVLSALGWTADSVSLLVCVTQTPRYTLPGNAMVLHRDLGLGKQTVAFDVALGCSGFVVGLWQTMHLMQSSQCTRALLVTGDTTSKLVKDTDRTTRPLFGDAAAALALELDSGAGPVAFDLGSDGAGVPYLMAPDPETRALFMDGTQVFVFTLREVPTSIHTVLQNQGWDICDVDHFIFHQANAQMLERLGQKLEIPPSRMVQALQTFGNTSSASIPLAFAACLSNTLLEQNVRLVVSGFGVGWSWASAALTAGPLIACGWSVYNKGSTD